MCNTPQVSPVEFLSWTDCTKAGAVATITVTNNHIEKFNKEKLYVSYFCTEHKGTGA